MVWFVMSQPAVSSTSNLYSVQLLDSGSKLAKLAAIGVKVDAHGITKHGFVFNVKPDMHYWEGIVGCGLLYAEICLAKLVRPKPGMEAIVESLVGV